MIDLVEQYSIRLIEYQGINMRLFYLLIAVIVIAVFIFLIIIFFPSKTVCGNDKCESTENCFECPEDCKCASGQYCSHDSKKCISPICGNDVCEIGETTENCCDDCGCIIEGEICNENIHVCEIPEAKISDERAIELATKYFEDMGREVISAKVLGSTVIQGKSGKNVAVNVTDVQWLEMLVVMEDGQIIHRMRT